MNTLHEKSICCGGRIIRFGERRRQCVGCKKTWRVWQRKRGRKCHRKNPNLLQAYFEGEFASIRKEAVRRRVHESMLRRRLHANAKHLVAREMSWHIPRVSSPVILAADGIIKRIQKRWWTVYLLALKFPATDKAVLLQPVMKPGRETYYGWQDTLNALPENIYKHIRILLCDGHKGLVHYGHLCGWKVQRCHAHLIFAITGRRSRSPWSRHRTEGERLYKLAKIILVTRNQQKLLSALNEIEAMGWTTSSHQLRHVINGFVATVDDYRTYLTFPALHVPTTNNALESFIGQFQELCHKARGFSSIKALKLWVTAFAKYKQRITCNGFYQPNKRR